jgi:YVTN family beta-propeller protein
MKPMPSRKGSAYFCGNRGYRSLVVIAIASTALLAGGGGVVSLPRNSVAPAAGAEATASVPGENAYRVGGSSPLSHAPASVGMAESGGRQGVGKEETSGGAAHLPGMHAPPDSAVATTISVGSLPTSAAYDSEKGEVFVTNANSDSVSVINDTTNDVVATVAVGTHPISVAYDGGKGEVFVTNAYSNNVSVISDATDMVMATVAVGIEPVGVAYDSGKGEVFVADTTSSNVSVISDVTNTVMATIELGTHFGSIGNADPSGVAYDSRKGEVFVTDFQPQGNLSVINDTTNTVVATLPVGTFPQAVVYDSGTGRVFVGSGVSTVSVISDSSNSVVATVPVGTDPTGAAYDSGKGEVFVSNADSNSVSVIGDATNMVVATVPVGSLPSSVAYDSGKGEVFVTNAYSNSVSVISDQLPSNGGGSPTRFLGLPGLTGYYLLGGLVAIVVVGTVGAITLRGGKTRGGGDSHRVRLLRPPH